MITRTLVSISFLFVGFIGSLPVVAQPYKFDEFFLRNTPDHAQNYATSPVILSVIRNNGYFSYNLTPDGEIDQTDYADAKAKFVVENPEGYAAMIKEQRGNMRIAISRSDYITFPNLKKNEVDNHPELYEIVDLP